MSDSEIIKQIGEKVDVLSSAVHWLTILVGVLIGIAVAEVWRPRK